jgi:hypothetical protein
VEAEDVDLREQVVQCYPVGLRLTTGTLGHQHAHAERFGDPGHRLAQFTITDNAQALARQLSDRIVEQTELGGSLPIATVDRLRIEEYRFFEQDNLQVSNCTTGLSPQSQSAAKG